VCHSLVHQRMHVPSYRHTQGIRYPSSPSLSLPAQRHTSKTTGHCALGKPSKNSLMLSLDSNATCPPLGRLLWLLVLAAVAAAAARELGGARREEVLMPPLPPRKAADAPVRPPPRKVEVLAPVVLRLTTMVFARCGLLCVMLWCVQTGARKNEKSER